MIEVLRVLVDVGGDRPQDAHELTNSLCSVNFFFGPRSLHEPRT